MKVYKLIEMLQSMDINLDVVVGSDDEGNGFRDIPEGWVSQEYFAYGDILSPEDLDDYDNDEIETKVVIG